MAQRSRILVAGSDPGFLDIIGDALSREGYSVTIAEEWAAAQALMEQAPPDVVVVDARAPSRPQWEFLRAYRRTPAPHALIVVLTTDPTTEPQLRGAHDAAHLKPFVLDHLLKLIEQYTESGGGVDDVDRFPYTA